MPNQISSREGKVETLATESQVKSSDLRLVFPSASSPINLFHLSPVSRLRRTSSTLTLETR